MKVVAWSQNRTAERAAEHGATLVDKDELLRTADVATIHLVLSDRTRGLIGARELGLMKPSALLVNTSRGPIVDEAALLDALRNRRIGGAAIDVYGSEPLPTDHPLRRRDNVQIGRASCRARVCHDVTISVVAQPLKKTRQEIRCKYVIYNMVRHRLLQQQRKTH